MKKSKKRARRSVERGTQSPPVAPEVQPASRLTRSTVQAVVREVVEVLATALVLAFLFRTFEAEAFVIPTGSMADTLMGRHKDVTCPMCGYPYQVSASEEVDSETGARTIYEDGQGRRHAATVTHGTCPMCHYEMSMTRPNEQKSYNGDRIVVNKFAYQFSDPQRFAVAVFHCPDQARTNYVKRITGLPGETVRIYNGDLFVRKDEQEDFRIARKPPSTLLAMLRTVYNNDYVLADKLLSRGWPARWQPQSPGGWTPSADHTSFRTDGRQPGEAWLRYHHIVPSPAVWEQLNVPGPLPERIIPPPRLIADDLAYNSTVVGSEDWANSGARPPRDDQGLGWHWVGDLAVACTLDSKGSSGSVLFELIEGGRVMRCQIDLTTGVAALSISGLDAYAPTAQTEVQGPGSHEILFANVDDQLRLWVDGDLVEFNQPTAYPPLGNNAPTDADLSPVGVASRGAEVEVGHLRVLRDTYYIAGDTGNADEFESPGELFGHERSLSSQRIADALSNPARYAQARRRWVDFKLEKDQFLALGDNSAKSMDSRLWTGQHYVNRDLLIGEALFIYWPHSWDRIPGTKIPFPFFPNVAEMGFVR